MTPSLNTSTRVPVHVLGAGCTAALAAGVMDVAIALLNKPRDFAPFGALELPILAVAAVFLAGYLALRVLMTPWVARQPQRSRGASAGLAAFLFTFVTLALLVGLHAVAPSAHSLFRAGIVATVSLAVGLGAFNMSRPESRPGDAGRSSVLLLAAPIVMFEILAYEWLQVYAIDSVASLASALVSIVLFAIVSFTVFTFARLRLATAVRALLVFVGALAATPVVIANFPVGAAEARPDGSTRPGAPRQVILITVDTLRRDAVSAYGQGNLTPAIDSLSRDAVVFDNAWAAAPWTLPSLASILSGLSPAVHGVTGLTSRLSDRVTTVAETLDSHGYRTAAIVHNPLLEPARNFAQGMGEYVDLHEPSYGDSVGARLLQTLGAAAPPSWPSTADQTDLALDWLRANRRQSFFLWLHYFDPHAPYAPPHEFVHGDVPAGMGTRFDQQTDLARGILIPPAAMRQWIRELYNAEVREVDTNIGRLLDTLRELQLYDDALIVFSSDHGEEFWEHGSQGHGQSLYPELLRVPLMLKLPRSDTRERIAAPVSTISITPTLLDLCGITVAPDDFSAPSLVPLLAPDSTAPAPPIVSSVVWTAGTLVDAREAIGFGDYHYIGGQAGAGRDELFDRRADPGDQHSLADSAPDPLATARRLLLEHAARSTALRTRLQIETTELGLDEETSKQLRTLGYVH